MYSYAVEEYCKATNVTSDPSLYLSLGIAYYKQAQNMYSNVSYHAEGVLSDRQRSHGRGMYEEGRMVNTEEQRKVVRSAIECLKWCCSIEPWRLHPHLLLGYCYEMLGNITAARDEYKNIYEMPQKVFSHDGYAIKQEAARQLERVGVSNNDTNTDASLVGITCGNN